MQGDVPDRVVRLLQSEASRRMFHSRHRKGQVEFDPSSPKRVFEEGDLVMRHVPRRRRHKQDPVYKGPMMVVQITSDRSYRIKGSDGREYRVHVDDIKKYTMPNAVNLVVNPEVLLELQEEFKVENLTSQQLSYLLQEDWKGRQIYVGVIFDPVELKCLVDKMRRVEDVKLVAILPELRFLDAYRSIEQGEFDLQADWIALPEEEDTLLAEDGIQRDCSLSGCGPC